MIFEKIKTAIAELIAKIKKAYKNVKPETLEGQIVASMLDEYETIQQMFVKAIAGASENFKNAEVTEAKNTAEAVKFSIKEMGFEEFDKQTLNNIKMRKGVVLNSVSELKSHIERALQNPQEKVNCYLGVISTSVKSKIEEDVGQKLFEENKPYTFVISYDDIQHISEHFNSVDKMVNEVLKVYEIIKDYDSVEFEIGKSNAKKLIFDKSYSDYDYRTVEIVSKSKSSLDLVTFFITKNNIKGSRSVPPATRGSLQRGSASNNRVPQNGTDVNTSISEKGVKYSDRNFVEDKYFKSQMSRWETLKHGSYVKVGTIGKENPLSLVGMPDGTLRYDVDKLKKNMTEHNDYLTVDLLKLIPDIIANPIAISEFSEENTVSVFGDVFVGSSPMMVGVTISKDRAGNDISKVRTYNTRRDVGKLITDDTVLYLNEDKKRTRKWFQACGIQVPLGETKFGFIRSISQKNSKSQEKNSDRDPEALTPRNLLANALEESAVHEVEKKKLAEYKENIGKLYEKEQELYEVHKEIKELSFAPGKKDTAKIKKLQEKAIKLSNSVTFYDKKLLNLESTTFLKNVLEREKQKAIRRQKEKDAERLKAQKEKALQKEKEITERYQASRKKAVESRNKTAMRNKIKRVVNELNQYLLHGTKDKHVMDNMKKVVAEALSILDMDTVGADERVEKYNKHCGYPDTKRKNKAQESIQNSVNVRSFLPDSAGDKAV
ncbi:MAG: hypothetical protein IJF20_02565 [Clostridia bacterium]|nr:hypothetical protein [Clostridia bacterium]